MNVLVLADDELMAEQIIDCLKKRFVRVTIAGTESCKRLRSELHCDRFIPVEALGPDACLEGLWSVLNQACIRYKIDVVMPAGTDATRTLASITPGFDSAKTIPLPDLDTFETLDNKEAFWRFLTAHEIPHPPTILVNSIADFDQENITAPVVIKAIAGQGSIGVEIVLDADRLKVVRAALEKSNSFPILAQEYIPGSDIDLSLLAIDGKVLTWTVQEVVGPLKLSFTTNEEVLRIGSEIMRLTGYSGVAHFDMRRHENGSIKLIECNPRFWFTVAASETVGINFPYVTACVALGKALPEMTYCHETVGYTA